MTTNANKSVYLIGNMELGCYKMGLGDVKSDLKKLDVPFDLKIFRVVTFRLVTDARYFRDTVEKSLRSCRVRGWFLNIDLLRTLTLFDSLKKENHLE